MTKSSYLKFFVFFICSFFFIFSGMAQTADVERIKTKVITAMGGQKAYDKTRYISWNFFGSRNLIWDKNKGRVRIDNLKENTVMILNINEKTGKVLRKGVEVTNPDSVSKYLEDARKIWINDSYWLVMPFKLSDEGVTAKYLGKSKTEDGKSAEILELTFEKVGVTPNNKYHIFFDDETGLVSQWSHFSNFSDEKPRFTMPWKDYQKYGKIMLSGDRGTRKLSNIMVFDKLDETIFSDFNKPIFIK
jgi:hypothetical protein